MNADEGRLRLLKDWMAELEGKNGGRMEEKMRTAVGHLDAMGYSAKWPPDSNSSR